jgi:hypothetical protein
MKRINLCLIGLLVMGLSAFSQTHTIHFSYTPPPIPVVDAGKDTMAYAWNPFTFYATVTGGTPPYTYLWQPGTFLNDSTVLNPTASFQHVGPIVYTLTVIDSNGCSASDQITIHPIANSIDETGVTTPRIHPNPTSGLVYIQGLPQSASLIRVELLSVIGETILAREFLSGSTLLEFDPGAIPGGMYILRITLDQQSFTHKIVIQ